MQALEETLQNLQDEVQEVEFIINKKKKNKNLLE
jgi:hypothetical protein